MKFQRTYSMQLEGAFDTHVINYPLSLEFDIDRNALGSANKARFQVKNLSRSTRRDVYHDRFNTLDYRFVRLSAGYIGDPALPIIFQGNTMGIFSYRQGQDYITDIDASDGGYGVINGQIDQPVQAGWNAFSIVKLLMESVPKTNPGAIGPFDIESSRGLSLSGNPWDILQGIAKPFGGQAFVDLEKSNLLLPNQFIEANDGIALITSETGLLNTPRRFGNILELDIIFEPRLIIGQVVQLRSIESVNDGTYKVLRVHHHGSISGAVDGGAITGVSLDVGTQSLEPVVPLNLGKMNPAAFFAP